MIESQQEQFMGGVAKHKGGERTPRRYSVVSLMCQGSGFKRKDERFFST